MIKNKKFNPFENLVLDDYEQEIENSLERGGFVSDPKFKETKKMFEEAAKRHIDLKKSKSITLRVKNEDLIMIKAKAKKNNIAYQSLIGLLINKYVKGETSVTL